MPAELLGEAVAQSLVAALVAEALVRLWPVTSPHHRFAWRIGALVGPLGLLAAFQLVAPERHTERFADGPALFASRHLEAVEVWGLTADRLWLGPTAALGLVLLLRDLAPVLIRPSADWTETPLAPDTQVMAVVERLCAARRLPVPPVLEVRTAAPVLLCIGARRPRLLVSTGVVDVLDEVELEAAIAHELAHLAHRDVLWGWALLGTRLVGAFNPVVQVLGRLAAHELELRADADAAEWTGRPATLASAVLKVYGEGPGWSGGGAMTLADRLQRARTSAVEERCRRLLGAPGASRVPPPGPLLSAAAGVAIGVLLFFVT